MAAARAPVIMVVPGTAALTDVAWSLVEPALPPQKPAVGRPATNHRQILEGMLWIMRHGWAWQYMPTQFGSWKTIYSRYQRWCTEGIWARIMAVLHEGSAMGFESG